jgi:hypothetical protein
MVCRALRNEWVIDTSDGSVAKFTCHTRYCGDFLFISTIEFGQNIFCNRAARPDLRAISEYGIARIDVWKDRIWCRCEEIERAKELGRKEVILPPGIDLPSPELSLEELLRDYGLLRVRVIDKETTVSEPYADILTWYKVEIVETLYEQRKWQGATFWIA